MLDLVKQGSKKPKNGSIGDVKAFKRGVKGDVVDIEAGRRGGSKKVIDVQAGRRGVGAKAGKVVDVEAPIPCLLPRCNLCSCFHLVRLSRHHHAILISV